MLKFTHPDFPKIRSFTPNLAPYNKCPYDHSLCRPRRPCASPLWQLVRHGWDKLLASYERKRRQLLSHLFLTTTETLRDAFRTRLDLPEGKLLAAAKSTT